MWFSLLVLLWVLRWWVRLLLLLVIFFSVCCIIDRWCNMCEIRVFSISVVRMVISMVMILELVSMVVNEVSVLVWFIVIISS